MQITRKFLGKFLSKKNVTVQVFCPNQVSNLIIDLIL